MNKDNLRKLILDNHKDIKELMLSDRQVDIIKYVESWETRSSDVNGEFDISIENASTQLAKLHRLGYLKREQITSESGGIEYIYKSAI